MIAQELEVSLHMAFVEARQARHEFITVEHLLLALLDNPVGRRGAARLRRQYRRSAQEPDQFHQRQHADRAGHRAKSTPSRRWVSSA